MLRKLRKFFPKKRAVSPILAAVLLIGLVITAGAVLFVVVIPLISGPQSAMKLHESDFQYSDTTGNNIYDRVTIPMINDGSDIINVTSIDISTSRDGYIWNPVNKSTGFNPSTIQMGSAKTSTISFVPSYTDFLTAGVVQYRTQVKYNIAGKSSVFTCPIMSLNQSGINANVMITTEFYHSISIGGHVVSKGARDTSSVPSTYANVIKLVVENNFAGSLTIDQTYGSYSNINWRAGLYVDNVDNGYSQTSSGEIYALVIRDHNFSLAWACPATSSNYDTVYSGQSMWADILGQSTPPTIAGVDNDDAQTIDAGTTALFFLISLGRYTDQYGQLNTGETAYLSLAFHSDSDWSNNIFLQWSTSVTIST